MLLKVIYCHKYHNINPARTARATVAASMAARATETTAITATQQRQKW